MDKILGWIDSSSGKTSIFSSYTKLLPIVSVHCITMNGEMTKPGIELQISKNTEIKICIDIVSLSCQLMGLL